MREYPIIVSDVDIYRLRGLLGAGSEELHAELEQAIVMPVGELPRSVVTMGSKVQARDLRTGRIEGFQLVFPREADPAAHRVSVQAPRPAQEAAEAAAARAAQSREASWA